MNRRVGQPIARRALVVKTCCLGDVLLATPLARTIARATVAGTVDWAVDRHSLAALANNPDVAARLDATGCVRGAWRPAGLLRLVREMRAGRYDLAFVAERSPVLALLTRLAGIPVRVGLDSRGRGRWHTVRVPVTADRHEAELYLDLARAVGLEPEPPRLVFEPTREDRLAAGRALAGLLEAATPGPGTGDGALVVVHLGGGVNPGMTLVEKRWPAERWVGLLGRMQEALGSRVVLLGGAGDRPLIDAVRLPLGPSVLDLGGRLSLGEIGALLERADLYLGHDTGVSHLATAVGVPAVVLFGPTDPRRYGPLPGTGVAVAPATGIVDQLAQARGSLAILDVTVEQVWATCLAVLERRTIVAP